MKQEQSRVVSMPGETWAYVSRRSGLQPEEIKSSIEKAFVEVTEAIARGGVRANGAPRAHYHYRDGGQVGFELGFPIVPEDAAAAQRAGLSTGRTLSGEALTLVHEGPYDGLASAYKILEREFAALGLKGCGDTWEVYLNDPDDTPADRLQTQLFWPISERAAP